MIADLDETIRQLLIDEVPIKNGEIDIKFEQPKREWSARLNRPTVNLFLYDVRENNTLRQHQWQQMGHNGSPSAHKKRTPLRVDCHYVLTTWATEPEDEHRLLTRCLMALFRYPIIPEERLVGRLKDQPFEIQARLASHDKLMNPAEYWSAMDNELRPSVSYLFTLALEPWQELPTDFIVHTVTMRTGQAKAPTSKQLLVAGTVEERNTVYTGGTAHHNDKPQANIEVALKGTNYISRTDSQGHYAFGNVPPGQYTLIIWPQKGKPIQKEIVVPSDDYNIEL